jgi:hypothetical protein
MEDFGAGIYRGRKAPATSAYDAVNLLVNDEGHLFRRGGSAYYSASDASSNLYRLNALFMRAPAANRLIARRAGSTQIVLFDASLAPFNVSGDTEWSRPASIGDYAVFAIGPSQILLYGGTQKSVPYSTGTVTVTQDDVDVTGAGTSWTGNVDAGMILNVGGNLGVVQEVTSNTALKLASPWATTTVAGSA